MKINISAFVFFNWPVRYKHVLYRFTTSEEKPQHNHGNTFFDDNTADIIGAYVR